MGKKLNLPTKILIGLFLGIFVGLFVSVEFASTYLQPIGTLFLRLIKMVIVPLVFASLIVGASSVGDVRKLGRLGGKTIAYYLVTTTIAVIIGITFGIVLQPGAGLELPVDASYTGKEAPSIINVLLDIVPDNPLGALVNGSMLQIIFFAIFIGIAITLVGESAEPVKKFFDGFADVMYKITGIVMEFAPYGVFGLIAPVVASYGLDIIAPLIMIIIAVYLGAILQMLIVYSRQLKFLGA